MKILILQDDYPPEARGGAAVVAKNLARALQKKGHEVRVVTATQNVSMATEAVFEGVLVHRIYSSYNLKWRSWRCIYNPDIVGQIRNILADFKPDIVHVHNIHQYISYYSLVIASRFNARIVFTVHDTQLFTYGKFSHFSPKDCSGLSTGFNYKVTEWQKFKTARLYYNPLRSFFINQALKNVDELVAISKSLQTALCQNGIYCTKVIYNGVDIESSQVSEDCVARFKVEHNIVDKYVLMFGGRLSASKGAEQCLKVLNLIVANGFRDVVLLVVGDCGVYGKKILSFVDQAGLTENIRFTGWLEGSDLNAAYASSDMVLVPSIYFDPFNLFNIEAMAVKKPVIGTCFGGTPEILHDHKSGYVVNPLNVETFAKKVIELIKNPERSKAMGLYGYKIVVAKFSLNSQTDEYLKLFEKVKDY